jgi:hypothetical protein
MWDEPLGLDTDQALGMGEATWSTGVGDLIQADDLSLAEAASADGAPGSPELVAPDVAEGASATGADVPGPPLPAELTFGALIGDYGTSADSQAEKIVWSTTDGYVGAETHRPMDEWTKTAK